MNTNGSPPRAEAEVTQRLHSAALVAAEMDSGRWPTDTETLDALAELVASASRWQLVVELERIAA